MSRWDEEIWTDLSSSSSINEENLLWKILKNRFGPILEKQKGLLKESSPFEWDDFVRLIAQSVIDEAVQTIAVFRPIRVVIGNLTAPLPLSATSLPSHCDTSLTSTVYVDGSVLDSVMESGVREFSLLSVPAILQVDRIEMDDEGEQVVAVHVTLQATNVSDVSTWMTPSEDTVRLPWVAEDSVRVTVLYPSASISSEARLSQNEWAALLEVNRANTLMKACRLRGEITKTGATYAITENRGVLYLRAGENGRQEAIQLCVLDEEMLAARMQQLKMTVTADHEIEKEDVVEETTTEFMHEDLGTDTVEVNSSVPSEQILSSENSVHTSSSILAQRQLPSIPATENTDEDSLTMLQRRELKKKQLEDEKLRRRSAYLECTDTASTAADDVPQPADSSDNPKYSRRLSTSRITDRFEEAKRAQQEREELRLQAVKARLPIDTSGVSSTRSTWRTAEESVGKESETAVTPNATTASSGVQRGKLKNRWEEVLQSAKQTEQGRVQSTRLQTISQFRVTDGTGMVRKRIGEWEELFMQLAATAEMMEEFFRVAQSLSSQRRFQSQSFTTDQEAMISFRENCLKPELFVVGDTHIYPANYFEQHLQSYFKRILSENRTDRVALACGVYGGQSVKPPIDVYAAVIRAAGDRVFVILTVHATAGHETDPDVFGERKVVVTARDIDQLIFEKILVIVPIPGWEQWIEGYSGPVAGVDSVHSEGVLKQAGHSGGADGTLPPGADYMIEETYVINQQERAAAFQGGLVVHGEGVDCQMLDEVSIPTGEHTEAGEFTADGTSSNIGVIEETTTMFSKTADSNTTAAADEEEFELSLPPSDPLPSAIVDESTPVDAVVDPSLTPCTAARTVQWTAEVATPFEAQEGLQGDFSSPTIHIDSLNGNCDSAYSATSTIPPDEGDGTWKSKLTPPRMSQNLIDDFSDGEFSPRHDDDISDDEDRQSQRGSFSDSDSEGLFDEDDDDLIDDQDDSVFNSGRPAVLPAVDQARSFLPSPIAPSEFSQSVHTQNRFSWGIEDESETGLPKVNHTYKLLNLNDIISIRSCNNLCVLQSLSAAQLFTGTLKHASTPSQYVLQGDRIFEYCRGAAASGWLTKYPMKSQNIGRARRRFFILRDQKLSYHTARPSSDEELYGTFSATTMLLTDNTEASIGRKYLTKCLTITTPMDTLWIRMDPASGDAMQWMSEISKAIQQAKKPKLFMSKPRVESKWFHESTAFQLRSTDVEVSEEKHCQIALFSLRGPIGLAAGTVATPELRMDVVRETQFSLDIASSEAVRMQLEILAEDGSPALFSDLCVSKIYGDVVLLGGSRGFLGFGVLSRTQHSMEQSSRRVIYCIPMDPCLKEIPTEDETEDVNAEGESIPKPSTLAGFSTTGALGYPHFEDSVVTAIGVAARTSVFAAADNEGVISLWHLPRNRDLCALSPMSAISPAKIASITTKLRPELLSAVNINDLDVRISPKPTIPTKQSGASFTPPPEEEAPERVVSIKFVCADDYLIVSTSRRLLLLAVQRSTMYTDKFLFYESAPHRMRSNSITSLSNFTTKSDPYRAVTGFAGYVTLDRALPGRTGLFDMFIDEAPPRPEGPSLSSLSATAAVEADANVRKIVQWKVLESDEEQRKNTLGGWFSRRVEETEPGLNRCMVSRIEWSESMFRTALDKLKPIPNF